MLDNLIDLFGALAVGVAAVASVAAIVWVFRVKPKPQPAGKHPEEQRDTYLKWLLGCVSDHVQSQQALVIVGTALFLVLYGISILVQDLTDHLVDSEYRDSIAPLGWTRVFLQSEKEHRTDALLERSGKEWALRGLGREIFGNERLLDRVRRQRGITKAQDPALEGFLALAQSRKRFTVNDAHAKAAKGLVATIYYRAKNFLSGHPIYHLEMKALQRRIDITRSLFLVAVSGLMALAVGFFIGGVRAHVLPLIRRSATKAEFTAEDGRKQELLRLLRRAAKPACVLTLLAVVGVFAYHRAENNFNERTFGYYSSHVHSEADKQP